MKPISVERLFYDVFDKIPTYEVNNVTSKKITFGVGEQKELNAVLITKQKNKLPAYPLLWYKLPNRDLTGGKDYVTGIFEFVLAHNTELDWFNDQRFEKVFETVLFPNFNLVMQTFQKHNRIDLLNYGSDPNIKYGLGNYPNYGAPTSFEGKDKTKQVDFWDAIVFSVKLRIKADNNCESNINYSLKDILYLS